MYASKSTRTTYNKGATMELQDLYTDDVDRIQCAPAVTQDLSGDQVATQDQEDHDLARFEGEGGSGWNV